MVFKKIETKSAEKNYWKFSKPGESVVGKLKEIQKDVGINKSIVYVLEESSGKEVLIWNHTTLEEKMNVVKLGDLIQIVFTGKKKNYYTFEVYIDDGLPNQQETTHPIEQTV